MFDATLLEVLWATECKEDGGRCYLGTYVKLSFVVTGDYTTPPDWKISSRITYWEYGKQSSLSIWPINLKAKNSKC